MTDLPLIEKRLAIIDTCVSDIRRLARVDHLDTDILQRRFVERTLQVAIQAALDVGSHIVSERRLGEPATNRDLFLLLERDGWITADLRGRLAAMAGFRNVIVYGYDDIDLGIVRDVVVNHLDELCTFADCIRRTLRQEEATPGATEPSGNV
jgi:uncharacterized protein YutE (UPF0331/DUF86 family)